MLFFVDDFILFFFFFSFFINVEFLVGLFIVYLFCFFLIYLLCLCKLLDVIIDNIILLCFIVFVVSRLLLVNCLSGVMFWGDREGLRLDWVVLFEFEWIGILFLLEFFLFFVLFMFLEEEL